MLPSIRPRPRPPEGTYSTFVHVSDREAITGPDDILGQSDYFVPVYGRHPTSAWRAGELVRQDHVVDLSPGRAPQTIVTGMYWQEPDGAIQQLGALSLHQTTNGWQLADLTR